MSIAGFTDGLSQSGLGAFDLLGFDACLMSDFEVLSALKSVAHYFLVSEDLEPGLGWNYQSWASLLGANATWSAAQLGAQMVQDYQQQVRQVAV